MKRRRVIARPEDYRPERFMKTDLIAKQAEPTRPSRRVSPAASTRVLGVSDRQVKTWLWNVQGVASNRYETWM